MPEPERATAIKEFLKSLSGEPLQMPHGGVQINFSGPILISVDRDTALELLKLLKTAA